MATLQTPDRLAVKICAIERGSAVDGAEGQAQVGGHRRGGAALHDHLPARFPRRRAEVGLHQFQGAPGDPQQVDQS